MKKTTFILATTLMMSIILPVHARCTAGTRCLEAITPPPLRITNREVKNFFLQKGVHARTRKDGTLVLKGYRWSMVIARKTTISVNNILLEGKMLLIQSNNTDSSTQYCVIESGIKLPVCSKKHW